MGKDRSKMGNAYVPETLSATLVGKQNGWKHPFKASGDVTGVSKKIDEKASVECNVAGKLLVTFGHNVSSRLLHVLSVTDNDHQHSTATNAAKHNYKAGVKLRTVQAIMAERRPKKAESGNQGSTNPQFAGLTSAETGKTTNAAGAWRQRMREWLIDSGLLIDRNQARFRMETRIWVELKKASGTNGFSFTRVF